MFSKELDITQWPGLFFNKNIFQHKNGETFWSEISKIQHCPQLSLKSQIVQWQRERMNVFNIKYSLQHGAEVFSKQICFAQMILESGGMYSTFYLGAIINYITFPFFSLVHEMTTAGKYSTCSTRTDSYRQWVLLPIPDHLCRIQA